MAFSITCTDCAAKRSNAQYRNTCYCHACRLLRDLVFMGDGIRKCSDAACSRRFAPVTRRDRLCGGCNYGSVYRGECKFCFEGDVELHRPGVALCVGCLRDPKKRGGIVEALKKGQRERRQANGHAP